MMSLNPSTAKPVRMEPQTAFAGCLKTHSHSIVVRQHNKLLLRAFPDTARKTTDISSVAHFRLPANVRG